MPTGRVDRTGWLLLVAVVGGQFPETTADNRTDALWHSASLCFYGFRRSYDFRRSTDYAVERSYGIPGALFAYRLVRPLGAERDSHGLVRVIGEPHQMRVERRNHSSRLDRGRDPIE